jgi:hypothetical protein
LNNQARLDFFLVQADGQFECFPLILLKAWGRAGKLGRFICRIYSRKANSTQRAKALADDVGDASPTPLKWHWYTGVRPGGSKFSWIECDGWAIDINSGGFERPIIIQRASDYRQNTGAFNIRLVRSEHGPQNVVAAISKAAVTGVLVPALPKSNN